MMPRLTSKMRVSALLRRTSAQGVMAAVLRSGDPIAGSILLLFTDSARKFQAYSATTTTRGEQGWMLISGDNLMDQAEADALVARQRKVDPDIWVLEIESLFVHDILNEPIVHLRNSGAGT